MGKSSDKADESRPGREETPPLAEDKDTREEQLKPFNEGAPPEDQDPALDTTKEAGQGTG